jgi:hypothetical protein
MPTGKTHDCSHLAQRAEGASRGSTGVRTQRAFPTSAACVTRDFKRSSRNHAARNGPCRDRTCDLGIKSPLLYQLS